MPIFVRCMHQVEDTKVNNDGYCENENHVWRTDEELAFGQIFGEIVDRMRSGNKIHMLVCDKL